MWPLMSSRTPAARAGEVADGCVRVLITAAGVRMRLPRQLASRPHTRSTLMPPTFARRKSEMSRGGHQLMSGRGSAGSLGLEASSSTRRATSPARRKKPAPTLVLAAMHPNWARTEMPRARSLGAMPFHARRTSGTTRTTRLAPSEVRSTTYRHTASSTASGPAGSSSRTAPVDRMPLPSRTRKSLSRRR